MKFWPGSGSWETCLEVLCSTSGGEKSTVGQAGSPVPTWPCFHRAHGNPWSDFITTPAEASLVTGGSLRDDLM